MRVVKLACIGVLLSMALVGSACGAEADSSNSGGSVRPGTQDLATDFVDMTGTGEVTIIVEDNTFTPQYVTVSPGTRITFENRGETPHNAIPVDQGAFDKVPTDQLQPGDRATLIIEDPGLYPYYCSLHGTPDSGMTGQLQVAPE